MTVTVKQPVLVWALLLVIVLMNGLMAAPSVSHAEHHAGHQAATHSTGICAWLCAGGVGIESSVVQFTSGLQLLEWVSIPPFNAVLSVISLSYFFRGPPSLSV
ncbi:MAG: hypothetical protein H8K03_08610 [Nitrospira sp.]|jgi:hypothetical protein|nr:hypothetical protein [Nitrospira sp. BO4]